MAYIRTITSDTGYGIGDSSLYVENSYTYKIKSDSDDFTVDSSEDLSVIKFNHFGSVFVRDILTGFETDEYQGDLITNKGMSNDCYVNGDNVNDIDNKKANCKWVDYVVEKDGSKYRLSFK